VVACYFRVVGHTQSDARVDAAKMPRGARVATPAARCRRKFLRFFPGGFRDPAYLDWERDYKWQSHERWLAALDRHEFGRLLRARDFRDICRRALQVEQRSRHSMLFSFEKMALRDALKEPRGARAFAEGLHEFLHGRSRLESRFGAWVEVVAGLPRRQTRVLTWPLVTVFGFIAQPEVHVFMKPRTIRAAAREYGFDLPYAARPDWRTYGALLEFAEVIRREQRDLQPRDMIDLQSFMWVQGSDEYD